MTLSATEQYLLELINRARLNPAAEAARFGIGLNDGLSAGTISTASKQVLAPNVLLENAATGHSLWMLANDIFSHTGAGGSSPGARATAQGYSWSRIGENIAWQGTTGTLNTATAIDAIYAGLFRSAGHRSNTLGGAYREIGLAAETGIFTSGGTNYNALMVTESFGTSGNSVFLTGVGYSDTDANGFYSIGEGTAGIGFSAQGRSASTAGAGGYGLALTASTAVSVTGSTATKSFSVIVDMSKGNVKLDVVNDLYFLCSGSIRLGAGIDNVRLIGLDNLNADGNAAANRVTGNAGNNILNGNDGNDVVNGLLGNDGVYGGYGNDTLIGDAGNDRLWGGPDTDQLFGGAGNDTLGGGRGNDAVFGGAGADVFQFMPQNGLDTISDFSLAQGDRLALDDALWGSGALSKAQIVSSFARVVAGGVLLDFGADEILLGGLTSTAGLANYIDVF